MRTITRLFCGLLPLFGAAIIGCGNASTGGAGGSAAVGTSQARIVLSAQGSQATTMHVTATDDATAAVVLDKSVDLKADSASMLNVALDAASYTIHVDAFDQGDSSKVIGSGDAKADLQAGQTTEVHLTADSSAGSGSGSVTVSVDMAPQINGIQVTLATDASSTGAAGDAVIKVDAVDPSGGGLTFFWSGLGLDGAVQGTSTLTISAAAAATSAGSPTVHLVVQDSAGATTAADIDFTGSSSCLLCGTSTTTDGTSADASATAQACLSTRASCNASCDGALSLDPTGVAAHLTCTTQCGLDLATCNAGG